MLWLNIPIHLGEYPFSLVCYPDISLVGKDRSHSRQVLPTMNIYKRISINLIVCTRPHTRTYTQMEWERHAGMDHVWWGEKCDENHIKDSQIKLGIHTHTPTENIKELLPRHMGVLCTVGQAWPCYQAPPASRVWIFIFYFCGKKHACMLHIAESVCTLVHPVIKYDSRSFVNMYWHRIDQHRKRGREGGGGGG